MFKVGDMIIYGSTGVCRVVEIKEIKDRVKGSKRQYYVLEPLYQSCVITTPIDNKKISMRPIITKDEAERLIDMIPTIEAEEFHSGIIRELTEHYQASIESQDCEELLEMTMSIYSKKQTMKEQKKKFGVIDERYMRKGEELLFGELAAALEIPREKVQEYISSRIKKMETK